MSDLLQVIVLGIVEGITEFLPISSTGHLLIAEHWLGERSELFNVAIQAGAILAVVAIYWRRLLDLALGFGKPENRDYLFKLVGAFAITAALGIVVKKLGWKLPEEVHPIAIALIVGGLVMIGVEAMLPKDSTETNVTWTVAIAVGLAQIVAGVFPGTSRSAASIFAAMLAGTRSRAAATEFSFLVGIPTMFAATGFELLKQLKSPEGIHGENWTDLAIGFVVSAIVAFIAVKWLLSYIQTHRFTAFAVYRIALGAALFVLI
ncbi:MAG TPA: undecaprenyl-diphosphate phosphatase [Nevskiaceae bacterium]|nr:undecaprenyl-diphosphate phosphatase [Nevskiaceae bacterium]